MSGATSGYTLNKNGVARKGVEVDALLDKVENTYTKEEVNSKMPLVCAFTGIDLAVSPAACTCDKSIPTIYQAYQDGRTIIGDADSLILQLESISSDSVSLEYSLGENIVYITGQRTDNVDSWSYRVKALQYQLSRQTAYTTKGTATKVPQITTNALGQVTGITEVDIQASGGGGNLTIVEVASGTATITAATGNYYRVGGSVGTLSIVLPSMGNETEVKGCVFAFSTASSGVAVTITSNDSKGITYYDGYAIEASKSYEINAIYNGSVWVVAYGLIQTT